MPLWILLVQYRGSCTSEILAGVDTHRQKLEIAIK